MLIDFVLMPVTGSNHRSTNASIFVAQVILIFCPTRATRCTDWWGTEHATFHPM